MKKSILALFLVFAIVGRSSAQANEDRVHGAASVVFFGMDFTFLKLIHEDGFIDKNGKPMCKTLPFKYFGDWNDMFLIEKEKFNMTRYFAFPSSTVDLTAVTERNKAYATDACIIEDESYAIAPADITATVALYAGKGGEGLGCVIIVESMNKIAGRCIFYTVFFDQSDGSVVKLERNEGSPVGYGFRNYWINAIDNGLDAVSNSYYKARKGTK